VSGGGEFQTLVTLLKSWGIPFDILRLDQTLMDPSHFADFNGRARYGAILWDAPGDISQADQAGCNRSPHQSAGDFGRRCATVA
jgi:hypothetical protein